MTISLNGSTEAFAAVVAEHVAEDEALYDALDNQPFCQPCGRMTDHVGEHEGAVLAGLAYSPTHTDRNGQRWSLGEVLYTDKAWDLMARLAGGRDAVRAIVANLDRAEYEAWQRGRAVAA